MTYILLAMKAAGYKPPDDWIDPKGVQIDLHLTAHVTV